jgi:hypothetical protein
MSRAFAVLSLSLFAACVGSSHAAPPPAHPQAVVWQAGHEPEDPYGGEDGGQAFAGQTCPPNSSCSFDCDGGGCAFFCAEGSTCNIQCDGGNCRMGCADNATCNLECDGGRCGAGCGAGATCNLECDGGSCAHACAPEASCNTECDGGNCT